MRSHKLVLFALLMITGLIFVNVDKPYDLAYAQNESLPHWIKHNAKWWYEGNISDDEFINCIKYLVEEKIIPIRFVVYDRESSQIPSSLKDIAYFWSIGKISDKNFIDTIRHLIETRAIGIGQKFEFQMQEEVKNLAYNDTRRSIVIVPVLTSSAYLDHGFYSYYKKECDKTCLTVKIRDDVPTFTSSKNAVIVLKSLGYNTITDMDVDKNPQILLQFDKVIVLHNEYVTQREFNAIINHPHVVYLYPNSLYAKVSIDYWNNTSTLISGHGYPDKTLRNGFGWKFDNSKFEYDVECANWNFTKIDNGIMLNCYPEESINHDIFLLQAIEDF